MLDPNVLFFAVAAAWFVLRIVLRRWSARKVAAGEQSTQTWALINAGTWAMLPLLAWPFVPNPDTRPLLLLIAATMFVFQFAMFVWAKRFIERG